MCRQYKSCENTVRKAEIAPNDKIKVTQKLNFVFGIVEVIVLKKKKERDRRHFPHDYSNMGLFGIGLDS